MSNVNTWLNMAKDQKVKAPVYVFDDNLTLALGLTSLSSTLVMVTATLRKGKRHCTKQDEALPANKFAQLWNRIEDIMGEIKNNWYTVKCPNPSVLSGQFVRCPDDWIGESGGNSVIRVFKCNKVYFMPSNAVPWIMYKFSNPSVIQSLLDFGIFHVTLATKPPKPYGTQCILYGSNDTLEE